MIYRTLKIYGHSISAVGNVTVDEQLIHTGQFTSSLLFKFSTDIIKHGSVDTNIILNCGQLMLSYIEVTYPAIINNNTNGFYTIKQPIAQPLVDVENREFLSMPLVIKDKLHYKHLMFNGPSFWQLEVDTKVPLYHGINVHDMFVNYRKAVWEYEHQPFTPGSLEDIKNLITW